MTAFEFIFPLFGLLVGLSYTEMLGGLARTLKSSREIRVGWLVPLLGLLVLINLTMFWFGAWQLRHVAEPTSGSLLTTLLVGGTYFLAASLVFPNPGESIVDLDVHFFATRRLALLAIGGCNLVGLGLLADNADWAMRPQWWIVNGLFLGVLVGAVFIRSKRVIAGLLVLMILAHFVSLVA